MAPKKIRCNIGSIRGWGGIVRLIAARLRLRGRSKPKRRSSHDGAPLGQRSAAPPFVDFAADEMALLIENVVDLCVN
jgi:hypothetical protein